MIHKSAIIEDGAKIGNNVSIGAFCTIGKDVEIGENTIIGASTYISGLTTIGKNNKISPSVVLGTYPQDLKYNNEPTKLIIGDNNKIREFCLINTGTIQDNSTTIIGDDNLIMSHCHIAHDCIINNNCIIASNAILAGHIIVDDYCFVGGASAIHQFVHLGKYSMLAGGGMLGQDLPPFCLAHGNRAQIQSLNIVGIRRSQTKDIDDLKKVFNIIFRNKISKEEIKELSSTDISDSSKLICDFILNSKRGIPIAK